MEEDNPILSSVQTSINTLNTENGGVIQDASKKLLEIGLDVMKEGVKNATA